MSHSDANVRMIELVRPVLNKPFDLVEVHNVVAAVPAA
jgi:hypothetical protein